MEDNIKKKETGEHSLSKVTNKMVLLPVSSKYGTQRQWNPRNLVLLACPDCELMLPNTQALLRHRMETHDFVPNFKCDLCGIILTHTDEISAHKAKHGKEKTEECVICKEKFTTETSLIRHMRYKHTYEKNFQCNICGKSFVEHYKLQIHIRQHTGEAPFSCNHCKAVFRSKISLKRHLVTHSSVREYICVLCFQQFGICNTLRQHMKKIHQVENIHHNGVKNSKIDGIPKTMQTYLLAAGKKIENFNRIKYYALKEEYESQLQKYFRQVSPLLLNGIVNKNVINFIPEGCKPKKEKAPEPYVDRDGQQQAGRPRLKATQQSDTKTSKKCKAKNNSVRLSQLQKVEGLTNKKDQSACVSPGTVIVPDTGSKSDLTVTESMDTDLNSTERHNETSSTNHLMETEMISDQVEILNATCDTVNEERVFQCITNDNANTDNPNTVLGNSLAFETNSNSRTSEGESCESNNQLESNSNEQTNKDPCTPLNVQALLRRIFIPLEDSVLQRMREGQFGKNPNVIEVLEDGTIVKILGDYTT